MRPELIDRVMHIAEREPDGDHYLSHFVLARKVLGESAAFAMQVANAYKHRRLTRPECEGMVSDWHADESEKQPEPNQKGDN